MNRRTPSRVLYRGLGALVAGLVLSACSDLAEEFPTSPSASQAPALLGELSGPDLGPAIAAANRHTRSLMANPAIVGTGVGLTSEGEPSVRLFLVHGQVRGLPSHLDGIPVSVEVTGPIRLQTDRTVRARPAPMGFSVGHPDITAGTLGARVTNGTSVFILSNNHVLANSNNAQLGDPILQPGAFDGGNAPGDVIGTLHDFYPFKFGSETNTMDAALALVGPNEVSGSTPDGAAYGAPSTTTQVATVGMGVQKYGRTTGHTFGTVAEVNVTVSVCIRTRGPFTCAEAATFVNQFTVSDGSFSSGGDSGSLIVTTQGARPTGLLFAGSSTRTIANPIDVVLDYFGVSIDPTVPDGSDPGDPPDPDPEDPEDPEDPADITLSVNAFKQQGLQKADLTWSGATSASVDIIRNGNTVATTANSGSYRDNINLRGSGTYTYRVCEAGTSTCSDPVTVSF
jgi:hypothetical protein